MSSRAVKFLSRAPRYTLSPNDNRYLRFARRDDPGRTYTTRFIDISQSGLAFVCDYESAPRISDLIKVEIPLNTGENNDTVAWWGRVVRVEEYDDNKWYMQKSDVQDHHQVLVAITFHEMPPAHSRAIRKALDKKFAEVYSEQKSRQWRGIVSFLFSNIIKFIFYAACILGTIWVLYTLSQPSATYDPKVGAPWGERFPNMPFKPGKLERSDK